MKDISFFIMVHFCHFNMPSYITEEIKLSVMFKKTVEIQVIITCKSLIRFFFLVNSEVLK